MSTQSFLKSEFYIDILKLKWGTFTLLFLFNVPVAAVTCYVNASQISGTDNGSSWANAYRGELGLQKALANSSCSEIWVAKGTYKPITVTVPPSIPTQRGSSFMLKSNVSIYGGFAGSETSISQRNWTANPTILSGDIGSIGDSSDNSYYVVQGSSVSNSAVLDGFTIMGGNADKPLVGQGGGIRLTSSSPILRNLIITQNKAGITGGGMYNSGSSPTLINVLFRDNRVDTGNGGGMHNINSSNPTLINVTFTNNFASDTGGGIYNSGSSSPSNPTLKNVILWGNTAGKSASSNEIGNLSPSTIQISYSLIRYSGEVGIAGADLGHNIITADSPFVSASDLTLRESSPAINQGDNDAVPLDVTTDFNGNSRVQCRVDMGAYEYNSNPPCTLTVAAGTSPAEAGPVDGSLILTRTGDLSESLTVNYTLSGTATPSVDYTDPNAGSVTFQVNQNTVVLTLTTQDDSEIELPETIVLTPTLPRGYTLAGNTPLKIADNESPLVISEIMYNPKGNELTSNYDGEWLEIYNPNSIAINLAGYVVDDQNDSPLSAANIPSGTIPPKGSVILFNAQSNNAANFRATWGTGINLIGINNWSSTLKLGNSGNRLGLWHNLASYELRNFANAMDDVSYFAGSGWPAESDGFSIYLTDLNADNNLGANWARSAVGLATPLHTGYTSTTNDVGSPDQPYTIKLTVAGNGNVSGSGFNSCRNTCSSVYAPINPVIVALTATPDVGTFPVTWNGGCMASFTLTNDLACTASFITDTSPPDTTITNSCPPATISSSSASFTFNGTDDLTLPENLNFECLLAASGGWFSPCSSPQSYTNLTDGTYTFQVRAKDMASLVDPTPSSCTWSVDTTPPAVNITNSATQGTSASFTFKGQDNLTPEAELIFECQLDSNVWSVCTSPLNYPNLNEGTHTFQVRVTDKAGLISLIHDSRTWQADITPPTLTLNNSTQGNSATFTFTGSDNVTPVAKLVFTCQLDNGANESCFNSKNYTNLSNGAHTFQVWVKDETNLTATSAYSWSVDTMPPTVTITNSSTQGTSASFTFKGQDNLTPEAELIFECQLDSNVWSVCTSPLNYPNLNEGTHTFQVRVTDEAGLISITSGFRTWQADITPPTLTLNNSTQGNSTTFTFTGSDNVTPVAKLIFTCQLDNGPQESCFNSKNYTNLSNGAHTFQVWVKDETNLTATSAYSWSVDTMPPTVTITNSSTQGTSASFSFKGQDNLTPEAELIFECQLDSNVWSICTSPLNYPNLNEGTHTFQVRVTDEAGLISLIPDSRTWRADVSAPTLTLNSSPQGDSATFTFTGSDSVTPVVNLIFTCQLDNGAPEYCLSPKSYSNLSDGTHTFQVQVKDETNLTATSTYTWDVDTTPPTVTITSSSTQGGAANFTFRGQDNLTFEVELIFECQLDSNVWSICTSPLNYPNLNEGDHTFQVRAKDKSGLVSLIPDFRIWKADFTAPTLTLNSSPQGDSATFTFTGSDSVTPVAKLIFTCQLDNGAPEYCLSPKSYSNLSDGAHTFQVQVKDETNLTATSTYKWNVDTSPPTVIITNSSTQGSSASFTFKGQDNLTAEAELTFECLLDGEGWKTCSSPSSYSNLKEGSHTFQVRAKDNNGLVTFIPDFRIWSVDTTGPTVTISQAAFQTDPTYQSPITFTVSFSEPVVGFNSGDVTLSGTAEATNATVIGSGAFYTVTVSGMTSSGTVIATLAAGVVTDSTGNPNLASTSLDNVVTYQDSSFPFVTQIQRDNPEFTNAEQVSYTVAFSTAVTGVDVSDFTLLTTGDITQAQLVSVVGKGDRYLVTLHTGQGEGTLQLFLQDDDSILDTTSSHLGGKGLGNGNLAGEIYTIDRTPPTAIIQPISEQDRIATIVFSEEVRGFDLSDLSLTYQGESLSNSKLFLVSGDSITWRLSDLATLFNGTGDYLLTLVANGSLTDRANNALVTEVQQAWSVNTPLVIIPPPTEGHGQPSIPLPPQLTLWVSVQGQGRVQSNPSGIDCTPHEECKYTFDTASYVNLTPLPSPGYRFDGWGGHADCADGQVFMSSSLWCEAYFTRQPLTLTVKPSLHGSVTSQPEGLQCGPQELLCDYSFQADQEIILLATPEEGWQWQGWQGACDPLGRITLTKDSTCEAIFEPAPPPSVTLTVTKPAHGQIRGGGLDCGDHCTVTVPTPSDLLLTAIPQAGYSFSRWEGDCQGSQNPFVLKITEPMVCAASFATLPTEEPQIVTENPPEEITPPTPPETTPPTPEVSPEETSTPSEPIPPEPVWPCPPDGGWLDWICHAQWQTIPGYLEIGSHGNLSHAKLAGTINNRGWVSNLLMLPQSSLSGGIVTGYITNQGLMSDFEFRGIQLEGGTLAGRIVNRSPVGGYFQDVQLAPHTTILGGKLAGHILGDATAPALLEGVEIVTGSFLDHVTLGQQVTYKGKVILGAGVQLLNPPNRKLPTPSSGKN